jgi:hypothetical protein
VNTTRGRARTEEAIGLQEKASERTMCCLAFCRLQLPRPAGIRRAWRRPKLRA